MRFLSLLFFLLPFPASASKIDYLKLRDSLLLQSSCGNLDSTSLLHITKNLESFDTTLIGRHIHQYYYDLGITYYKLAGNDVKGRYWQLALHNFEKSAAHERNPAVLWQCAFCAFFSQDCQRGSVYLAEYIRLQSRKKLKRQAEQIKAMEAECNPAG